ncbi:MAG: MoaD/ThiS family protein [Chloroflexota bacterium]
MVKVRLAGMFQPAAGGKKTAEFECDTIGECLKRLVDRYPSLGKIIFDEKDTLAGNLVVFVNGKSVTGDILATAVKPGDEVFPLMIIDGG